MVTKLQVYNAALRQCGIGRLNRLEEDRDDRRELDAVYDHCIDLMLEKASWNFALRTVLMEADTDIEPDFGYSYAYTLPDDYKGLAGIGPDERMRSELRDYQIQNEVLYADWDSLYFRYVSNGPEYGLNLGIWPAHFTQATAVLIARESGLPMTKDRGDNGDLYTKFEKALREAKTYDAIDDPVKVRPPGRLAASRSGRHGYRQRINDTHGRG